MEKILVVDDDADLRTAVQSRLESQKYTVRTACDGIDALQQIKANRPDLIVLDTLMPNMDGYSFVQEIKYEDKLKNIPILIFTEQPELQSVFEIEGIRNFVNKPFHSDSFIAKVKTILGPDCTDESI